MPTITVEISDHDWPYLEQLCGEEPEAVARDLSELLEHLARHAADGVRRPGAWERDWITQATGWADGYAIRF